MKKNKKIIPILIAALMVVTNIVIPVNDDAFAEVKGKGEQALKNLGTIYAVQECLGKATDATFKSQILSGQKASDMIKDASSLGDINLGKWLGTVKCSDAFKTFFNDYTVSDSLVTDDNNILHGVYGVANTDTFSLLDKPAEKLSENIKNQILGGKTPAEYFDSKPSLQYVYYGRVLFNGDGKYSSGCGGISVATDDPKIEELKSQDTWKSDTYVKTTRVYDASGANEKQYLTKIGAKDSKSEGEDKTVKGAPWKGNPDVKCSAIVTIFNNLYFSGDSDATAAVYGYLKPVSAEDAMKGVNPGGTEDEPEDPGGGTSDPPSGDPVTLAENSDTDCYTNAGSLGWIICPILTGAQDFIMDKYMELVEPALQIDVSLFTPSEDNGTYYAWNIFRNIANTAFVIMLVLVIFSQVTGFGIDNYGIKKALPKLIVAAILINLSFIVCQVAIDIGNIVGRGVGSIFVGISNSLEPISSVKVDGITNTETGELASVEVGSDSWLSSLTSSGWNAAIIIIVAVIAGAAILSQGWAIIIPVILALISIVIAIFGLIVILGIRQAAAVLLVVFSPIAFVCYMLPNTQSVFKKWFGAFKALLIAYPVCSALVFGGDMVSNILLRAANGNFWIIISAGVIGVAPIFFIPKVISASLGAISGGIMRLTGKANNKARGAANRRLENSRLTNYRNYKQQMRGQRGNARMSEYNAKRGKKVLEKYSGREGELNAFERRKYNAAMSAVNAQTAESLSAQESRFAGYTDDKIVSDLEGAAANGHLDGDALIAGLKTMQDDAMVTKTLRNLAGTQAYKDMVAKDANIERRLGGVLSGRSNSVVNQSMGKLLTKGETMDSITANDNALLRSKVQDAGTSVMANQSAAALKTEGLSDLLSDEQLRAAATSGYSGDKEENFYQMMSGVSGDRKKSITAGMSQQDIGTLRKHVVNGEDHGSLAAIGGAGMFKNHAAAHDLMNSQDGKNIRTQMQGEVLGEIRNAVNNGSRS